MDPEIERMLGALERYDAIAAVGGWPVVSSGPALRIGASGTRVRLLRARLDAEANERERVGDGEAFDELLYGSVRHFQRRHGIEDDGVVGAATLAALNAPAAERARQLRVNVARLRASQGPPTGMHVVVNVPAFELVVRDGERPILAMRVIVGRRRFCTPEVSSQITDAIVNPYWNLPARLAREEIEPLVRKDPAYLTKEHIRVFRIEDLSEVDRSTIDWKRVSSRAFPFRLRQDPGPWNALGRVKFVFPNRFNVFLHDTPARSLFARPIRAFSHGCIRLEDPIGLAEALLGADSGWSRLAILAAIERGETQTIHLREPVPIQVVYRTAWVDDDGSVEFRADFCGRDVAI